MLFATAELSVERGLLHNAHQLWISLKIYDNQGRGAGWGDAGDAMASHFLADQIIPYSNQGTGGRLCPPNYYWSFKEYNNKKSLEEADYVFDLERVINLV